MFLFQTSANATAGGTAATGKTLSAQEFSKKVDQLYVRTEVSFREAQRSIGALDFGDRLLNRSWLEILAGGLPGALAYSEIAPGATGQARTNYLSSVARIMAQQIATWTDDSHAGNFMVSWDGKAIRIDIGDFSTKLGEKLSALDRFMDRTIGEPTPAEMRLMHDAFVSEWMGMRENFLKPGNAVKIKAEYAQYWSNMPEIGKQMYETLEFYLTKMAPEQAWGLFLNGPPKVSR